MDHSGKSDVGVGIHTTKGRHRKDTKGSVWREYAYQRTMEGEGCIQKDASEESCRSL
jgi:hypothetical protein